MTDRPKPGEFELIRRHFGPLATTPGALGLSDDAALLATSEGTDLVLTADALIGGVHFLEDDPADLVARKLLRVNLSDLAAMGAVPLGYLLTTAWPAAVEEDWIAAFAAGLAADQKTFDVALLGGDTVSTTGPIALSLTAIGQVPAGAALRRDGARPGDRLFLTGSLGDGALGLLAARGELAGSDADDLAYLERRYRLPEPRTAVGPRLIGVASAAIDVSDGLIADAGHLVETSAVAIEIERAALPLSPAAARVVEAAPKHWPRILGGGDDYELLFSASPKAREQVEAIARESGVSITEIGVVDTGDRVDVLDADGKALELPSGGWQHF
jgi:thiamine-monophosphate kinase